MSSLRRFTLTLISVLWLASGCALLDDSSQKKTPSSGFIVTPATYYSTQKARYLGTRYKENLERLAATISKDPKTASLQFANNISSVGGIGFFTHSATKTPDERYLEVVLATPETFATKEGYSEKVAKLFAEYGSELLRILVGDKETYQDKELSGYGLNLAWGTVVTDGGGSRVVMARAVVYFPKERVANFLRKDVNANDLLANAVIFAVEEDGPLQLVSYQPQQSQPDYRPAIREDNLDTKPVGPKAAEVAASSKPIAEMKPKVEGGTEVAKRAPAAINEPSTNAPTAKATPAKSEVIAKATTAEPRDQRVMPLPPETVVKSAPTAAASPNDGKSETLAADPQPESLPPPVATTAQPLERAKGTTPIHLPATAVSPPTGDILGSDKEDWGQPNKPAVTPPKPEVDMTKNQPIETTVTKPSQEAPSNIAEPTPEPDREREPPETVVGSPAEVKPLISTDVSEKAGVAAPVAILESRELAAKQPEKVSDARRSAAPLAKSPQAPVPASKPNAFRAAEPATKSVEPEIAEVPVQVTMAKPNTSAPVPQPAKLPETKRGETNVVSQPAVVPPAPPVSSSATKTAPAVSAAKSEPSSNKPAVVEAPVPVPEKSTVKSVPEQLASLKKPQEVTIDNKSVARPVPKPLEGFIIQVAFNDKEKAQSWAEKMEHRGYAVSLTAAGSEGALRVRLGNFAVREEAERQLNNLKSDGMKGIIINLPQAFRPEARSSLP